ncbi:MAG: hypothetical protein KDD37_01555 [Bdellovibrionales bacterium]|nr:hypothetical protein [Bdellovibrionales bacterium]
MIVLGLIWGTLLWAKGPDCSSLFDVVSSISVEADLVSEDLLNKDTFAVQSKKVVVDNIIAAKSLLLERKQELMDDKLNPDSIYNHIQYNFSDIIKSIDDMVRLSESLRFQEKIPYKEYFSFFYRLSAVLSFLKTGEVQKIFDSLEDYFRKGDPNYDVYTFSRENFDHFADYAISGVLPSKSEIDTVLNSKKARVYFIYKMPSLSLLSQKMVGGVVYATIDKGVTSFDGGLPTFPFDLAKHDVDHAARFIAALERNSIDIKKFVDDNKKILDAVEAKLTAEEIQLFWSIHFSRNHEGSYDLTFITPDGKYSWLGMSDQNIIDMVKLNPPDNWHKTTGQNLKIIQSLRRKGFL